MTVHRLVYLEPVPPDVEALVRARIPPSIDLHIRPSRQSVADAMVDADFALVATTPIDAGAIASARHLRLIQHQGVGYDRTDVLAAASHGIPVATCPAGTTSGVAEHVILLVLAVFRRLLVADEALRRGEWLQWDLRPSSFELEAKTFGILGFGLIGRRVAELLQAFRSRVIYYDIVQAEADVERRLDASYVPLDDLLSRADVLSIHVPLTPQTRHMIGVAELRRMKASAVVINTARGGIVDDAALAAALLEGRLAGAGIDVFEHEPPPVDHPLLSAPRTVLTPHIAAGTSDGLAAKIDACVINMLRVADGLEPLHQVQPVSRLSDMRESIP
jgi:phosphoglycerate dehydrogenase-like enzyme